MAAFDTTRPHATVSAGGLSKSITSAFAAFAAWNDARVTRKALKKLSARELSDIGLHAGDIEEIFANHAKF